MLSRIKLQFNHAIGKNENKMRHTVHAAHKSKTDLHVTHEDGIVPAELLDHLEQQERRLKLLSVSSSVMVLSPKHPSCHC